MLPKNRETRSDDKRRAPAGRTRNFDKLPIVDVIERYVPLEAREKSDGLYYVGLCPFHDDTNPSLVVYPNDGANGVWQCFVCSEKAQDSIAFVMAIEHCDFKAALELCASSKSLLASVRADIVAAGAKKPAFVFPTVRVRRLAGKLPYAAWLREVRSVEDAILHDRSSAAERRLALLEREP